jgi:hypothetical protein
MKVKGKLPFYGCVTGTDISSNALYFYGIRLFLQSLLNQLFFQQGNCLHFSSDVVKMFLSQFIKTDPLRLIKVKLPAKREALFVMDYRFGSGYQPATLTPPQRSKQRHIEHSEQHKRCRNKSS